MITRFVLLTALILSATAPANAQKHRSKMPATVIAPISAPALPPAPIVQPVKVVTAPAIPSSLDFAGERVPLENFDTRESLMREMLITCNMHSRTMLTLLNSERYMAIIKPILREMGVPEDFVYLCMAESGLDPNIVSSARAAGLWQLMPATGTSAGLEVNAEVDERYDVERATRVAARHLLDSFEQFGSWTLAAAAYNLGDAGVSRRLGVQEPCKSYYDIWLPDETRRYVFRVLSFKLLCSNPLEYGFDLRGVEMHKHLTDYHTITTSERDIKWPELAVANGTTYKMLRELNHWIRDYEYANAKGRTLTIKIPNKEFRSEK